jgi:hypothetical protein
MEALNGRLPLGRGLVVSARRLCFIEQGGEARGFGDLGIGVIPGGVS